MAFISVTSVAGNRRTQPTECAMRAISRKAGMRKLDRPIAAAVPGTLLPRTIQGRVLSLDVSILGSIRREIYELFVNYSSNRFFCELFFIQGADKSALIDPSHKRWIDDKTRIGLLCLRVMSGDHVKRTGYHLH